MSRRGSTEIVVTRCRNVPLPTCRELRAIQHTQARRRTILAAWQRVWGLRPKLG
jgi:hypothetical protein